MHNQNKQVESSQYSCAFHPGNVAKWACQNCKSLFCESCVVHKAVGKFKANICPKPECRGRCVAVAVDEFSGSVEEVVEPKEEEKSLIKKDTSHVKRYLTRYYFSLIFPGVALITYDIMIYLQGRSPQIWLIVAWALLIFLMSGRYFWAYVFVASICFFHTVYSFYRIYAHTLFKDSSQLVNWIAIGLWLASFLILACSHSEFSE